MYFLFFFFFYPFHDLSSRSKAVVIHGARIRATCVRALFARARVCICVCVLYKNKKILITYSFDFDGGGGAASLSLKRGIKKLGIFFQEPHGKCARCANARARVMILRRGFCSPLSLGRAKSFDLVKVTAHTLPRPAGWMRISKIIRLGSISLRS